MAGRVDSLRRFAPEVVAICGRIATSGWRLCPGMALGSNLSFPGKTTHEEPPHGSPAQYIAADVRSARCGRASRLRTPGREIAEHRCLGGARQRVRELLHQLSALRTGAPGTDD